MNENKLKLNNHKTEVLVCSTESKQSKVHISDITLGGTIIAISDKSKHLAVILDIFSMEHEINAVVEAMYFEIRNISRMKSILSYDSVKTLVTSFFCLASTIATHCLQESQSRTFRSYKKHNIVLHDLFLANLDL